MRLLHRIFNLPEAAYVALIVLAFLLLMNGLLAGFAACWTGEVC